MNCQSDSSTSKQSLVQIRAGGAMVSGTGRLKVSHCDSCDLRFDDVLRHVPLKDGGWICLYCLRHPAVQRQYVSRLAVRLKGVEIPANHAAIAGIRRCALNSRCLRAETRKGYPVGGRGLYCSSACLGRAKAIAKAKPAAVMVEV